MILETLHVNQVKAVTIQDDGLAFDQDMRGDEFVEIGQGLAQIRFGVGLGHIGPQQPDQFFTRLRPAGEGEVDQQRLHFAGDEAAQRLAVEGNLQAAQCIDSQRWRVRHRAPLIHDLFTPVC